MQIKEIRNEVDLYGYSVWLAQHLGYDINPISLRGFQHGWIWWDPADMPCIKGYGIDINMHDFWGILVQDERVAESLRSQGYYARPCGLPFLNFYQHSGLKGWFSENRESKVLYVPAHSNPWNNYSEDILRNAKEFAGEWGKCSIMLSWSDRHLAPDLGDFFTNIEIGAGVFDTQSFYRLVRIFESYEYVITDAPGSHICYALACGAKVGLHSKLYKVVHDGEQGAKTQDSARFFAKDEYYERKRLILNIDYIDRMFPGLVIDGGLPVYGKAPEIVTERPHVIADLLGWNMTYPTMMAKGQG